MTPEEIITSPEEEIAVTPEEEIAVTPEVEIQSAEAEAAEELSQLLSDPEPALLPEEAEPVQIPVQQPAEEPVLTPVFLHNEFSEPEEKHAPVKRAEKQAEKKVKKERRKPHIALRILLQLISLVLSLVLFVSVVAGVLVADLRQLTSAGGIKQLITMVLGAATAAAPADAQAELQVSKLSNWTIRFDETDPTAEPEGSYTVIVDENGNVIYLDENGNPITFGGEINIDEIPEDILTGGATEENMGSLVDWIYDQVEQSTGSELQVSKDKVQSFVEQSTVSDYLSDKLAGFAEDFINGTENTNITTDEIMDLLEENEELLKSELEIELTPEQKEQIQESVDQIVVESDINNTIRQEVSTAVDSMLEESSEALGGISLTDIQTALQLIVSDSLFNAFLILSAVLLLLLCLVNFYNVPAGLTWASLPCILAGGILSLPFAMVGDDMSLIDMLLPAGNETDMISSFLNIFQPIHALPLYIGLGLLVVSIVWRFIRAVVRKVQAS